MNRNKFVFSIISVGLFLFFLWYQTDSVQEPAGPTIDTIGNDQLTTTHVPQSEEPSLPNPPAEVPASTPSPAPIVSSRPPDGARPKGKDSLALPYVLEDGVVVVQGDWVVGRPVDENADEKGWVEVPQLNLWPSPIIPYHIDPSLKNPERVHQALAMFEGTAIQFVPFQHQAQQKDVLVFVDGTGTCKSYVGKVGGHQPVWLPAGCGPQEIAHELMHALGFVHEQNRSDRDQYLQVHYENIEEPFKDNFEKLPPLYMKASGQGRFDFDSVMIYPAWMFAKSGRSTMQSKSGQPIMPSRGLSRIDIERLNRIYGRNEGGPNDN